MTRDVRDFAKEGTDGFNLLKTLLERTPNIYANHKVRLNSLLDIPVRLTSLQESVAVGNKVMLLLSHIASLDALFATPPGDVPELRRRDELILYVMSSLCQPVLSSFQRTQGLREEIAIIVRGARISATLL